MTIIEKALEGEMGHEDEEMRNALADELGLAPEDRERLKTRYERWDKALKRGILVDVHVSKWHPTFSLDVHSLGRLGLVAQDADRDMYKAILSLGQIYLLPRDIPNSVKKIEYKARAAVKAKSNKLLFGNFVAQTNIEELLDTLKEIEKEFYSYVDYICDNLDDLRSQMDYSYHKFFTNAWQSLEAQRATTTSLDAFIQESIDYVRRSDLEVDEIRDKFSFDYELRAVPFRDQLAEQQQRAAELEKEAAESREALSEMTRSTQSRIELEMRGKAEGEMRRFLSSIDEAEQSIVADLSTACGEIAQAMADNDKIPGKCSTRINNTIQMIKSMREAGLFDQENLFEAVEQVETQLALYRKSKSSDKKERIVSLETQLRALGSNGQTVLKEMKELSVNQRGVRRRVQPRSVKNE